MTQSVWIDGPVPGMNEIVAAAKGFKGRGFGYSKMKKEWTAKAKNAALAAGLHPVPAARFEFHWSELRRQRDPDNFSSAKKFLLDGFVEAGIIANDGWSEVIGFTDTWRVDKDKPGVLVTLVSP